MPYVKQFQREGVNPDYYPELLHPGVLNFTLARVVSLYVRKHGISYQTFHDVVGVLRDLATEIERRFVGPYEDKKLAENGEVFQEIVDALKERK